MPDIFLWNFDTSSGKLKRFAMELKDMGRLMVSAYRNLRVVD